MKRLSFVFWQTLLYSSYSYSGHFCCDSQVLVPRLFLHTSRRLFLATQPVSFVLCASTEWTSCPHVVVLGSSSCDLWSQRVKVFYFHRAHFFQIPSLSAFSLLSCHLSFLLPTCRHLAENISLFTRELIATVAAVLLQVAGCRLPGCCLIS